jgi:hypothetical protein
MVFHHLERMIAQNQSVPERVSHCLSRDVIPGRTQSTDSDDQIVVRHQPTKFSFKTASIICNGTPVLDRDSTSGEYARDMARVAIAGLA